MVYQWKDIKYSVPAEVVGKQFEKILEEQGSLTNKNVLESAKDESSPIHEIFEWDDTVAAEKYRLTQATKLITNLQIILETEEKEIKCRAYVNIANDAKEGKFIHIESAFQNEDTKDIVLNRAMNELRAFKEKYKTGKK